MVEYNEMKAYVIDDIDPARLELLISKSWDKSLWYLWYSSSHSEAAYF